jgi:hypothetical protein
MPIFRFQNRVILFIHIPKSGGTSLNAWLRTQAPENLYMKHRRPMLPLVPQHFHAELVDALFAPGFFDYSFCVTRNPYARILSEYNYRITRPKLVNQILPKPSFKAWLTTTFQRYGKDPYIFSNHVRPQHEFPIEGTEVFRLEDGLERVGARLQDLTGSTFPDEIPRHNTSEKSTTEITEAQADLIHSFYKTDFERFGYDPDSWREI